MQQYFSRNEDDKCARRTKLYPFSDLRRLNILKKNTNLKKTQYLALCCIVSKPRSTYSSGSGPSRDDGRIVWVSHPHDSSTLTGGNVVAASVIVEIWTQCTVQFLPCWRFDFDLISWGRSSSTLKVWTWIVVQDLFLKCARRVRPLIRPTAPAWVLLLLRPQVAVQTTSAC